MTNEEVIVELTRRLLIDEEIIFNKDEEIARLRSELDKRTEQINNVCLALDYHGHYGNLPSIIREKLA